MDEVRKVSPSPLTGRVLVEFAEAVEDIQPVLDAIADLEPPPDYSEPEIPPHPLDPGPIIEGASKLAGAAIGLGLLMVRRATGANEAPVARAGPGEIAGCLALLETEAGIADRIEAAIGHRNKEIAFGLVGIVSMTSAGSALGLLYTAASAIPLVNEARARRGAWREYQRRLGDAQVGYAGAVVTLSPGERSPLRGVVRDGFGVAVALDGTPQRLAPGAELTSGSRVYGGPVTVELQEDGGFEPRPRPGPPPNTFYDRYLKTIPYAALAY
ncbi:MAG TPA: hypothetical protein VF752_00045, partial [Thermoleophilaceae bacterium]